MKESFSQQQHQIDALKATMQSSVIIETASNTQEVGAAVPVQRSMPLRSSNTRPLEDTSPTGSSESISQNSSAPVDTRTLGVMKLSLKDEVDVIYVTRL